MNTNKKILCILCAILTSCSSKPDTYISACEKDNIYQKVEMDQLLININGYDGKYVEIKGKYQSGYEESALYAKGFNHSKKNAIWVGFNDFILRCPLLLLTKEKRLRGKKLPYEDMYDKTVVLHGKIDAESTGHLSQYKATITDITLVAIE